MDFSIGYPHVLEKRVWHSGVRGYIIATTLSLFPLQIIQIQI